MSILEGEYIPDKNIVKCYNTYRNIDINAFLVVKTMTDLELAHLISEKVDTFGGSTYFVGGYVRDKIMGIDNKDIDIEVHGITPEQLKQILSEFGAISTKGVSFGVFGIAHHDLDISMPRFEHSSGSGHRNFDVFVNPYIGPFKASERRDFTINAIMQNVLTGEIVDFHEGLEDIEDKLIRAVDSRTFLDDPLRALRAAQFAARFEFDIASDTIELCKQADLSVIPSERIQTEFNKALLKAEKPSIFFESLRKMNQLDKWFPELEHLIGVPQEPSHHPEGDAWTHTMMVIDEAAKVRQLTSNPLGFMMSAVYHDIGKVSTTTHDAKGYHSYDHHIVGAEMVKGIPFLKDKKLRHYVSNMVGMHMKPHLMVCNSTKATSYCKMFDESVAPKDLIYLAQADKLGRAIEGKTYDTIREKLFGYLDIYNDRMAQPCVTGRDLLEQGFKPGPIFTEALQMSHNFQVCGTPKKQAMSQIISFMNKEIRKQEQQQKQNQSHKNAAQSYQSQSTQEKQANSNNQPAKNQQQDIDDGHDDYSWDDRER